MLFAVSPDSVRAEPKFPFVLSLSKNRSAGQPRLRAPKLERIARQASLRLPPSARGEGSC